MQFSKMHGLGNDFIIIDSITQNIHLNTKTIKHLSNRYYGIGCDQLIVIEPPYDPEIDFHCRIYNADGTEVNQCGNGLRCCAKFVYMKKLTNKQKNICISTRTNHMILSIINNNYISAKIEEPIFDPKLIPFYATKYQQNYILFTSKQTILCSVVSIGNPHCVILVEKINNKNIITLGEQLEQHHRFPERANISFMQIINKNYVKLRVYERGVGETKACGSAACAAVSVGIKQKLLKNKVKVHLPGGVLSISWNGMGYPLYMSGTAHHSYDGIIDL